jgi:hypothetical protein
MGRPALKFCDKHQLKKKKIGRGYYCLECKKETYRDDKLDNPDKYLNTTEKLKQQVPDDWNEKTIVKICNIHGELKLKDVRYLNPNNMRCKECVREKRRISHDKNRDEINAKIRERRKNDHEFAEYKREQSRIHKKNAYAKNRDKILQNRRDINANDPNIIFSKNLRKNYGLTIQDYFEMVEKQNNLCAICKQPETAIHPRTKEIKKLGVDHNHSTNEVRALLCTRCNCMIGYARESEKLLQAAVDYLRNYNNGVQISSSIEKC